jgi:hypothetical protein
MSLLSAGSISLDSTFNRKNKSMLKKKTISNGLTAFAVYGQGHPPGAGAQPGSLGRHGAAHLFIPLLPLPTLGRHSRHLLPQGEGKGRVSRDFLNTFLMFSLVPQGQLINYHSCFLKYR